MNKIEVRDVSKIYQMGKVEVPALSKVDLDIHKGEFTVLAGPSGSGKTTLLNMIGVMDKPTEGKVSLDDEEISKYSLNEAAEYRRQKTGFIFQQYNLIPVLTAWENIIFSLDLLNKGTKIEREEKVRQIMMDMDIFKYSDHRPDEMSGGQQQRVAIARALVKQPAIILADEPTANLDSKTGDNILRMMRDLNEKKGVTFIFSSHNQKIISYAKRVVWLVDGQIDNIEER